MGIAAGAAPRPAIGTHQASAWVRVLPRLSAFLALGLLGLLTWAGLVAPAPRGSAVLMALTAAVAAAGLVAAGAIERSAARNAALAVIVAGLAAAMLLGAGIPARLLVPDNWDVLITGVIDGIVALPGTFVPYAGSDVWLRRTLLLGGTALVSIAVLQAFWPRERGRLPGSPSAAIVSLGTLYAVPVISRSPDRPFLSGALFTLLLCAFLLADRMRPATAGPAAVLVVLVTMAAAAAAPALDRPAPWLDYEHLAEDVSGRDTVGYVWDHTYRPIDWPRKGTELLRVKPQAKAYWKAEALDDFDGRVWRRSTSVAAFEPDGEQDRTQPHWFQTIRVSIRGLRTSRFVTAGSANRVEDAPRQPVNAGAGTFETTTGVLRRGAEYRALVYTPRPTPSQLAEAGTGYPSLARQWLRVELPRPVGAPAETRPGYAGPWAQASFPPFGSGGATLISRPQSSIRTIDGVAVVRSTPLRRIYELAARLRARSGTPHEYVELVRARVHRGASYSERPRIRHNPLDAFLFEDRIGYCQQFSGAMALLLRMGGIPARVAVGFSPGALDRSTGEYVVRDFDAHSWVEAYFPRYGWITFDPTPSASPAREQIADRQSALTRPREGNPGGDRTGDAGFGGAAANADSGGRFPFWAAGGVIAALLAGVALLSATRARRRVRTGPRSNDPYIAELERALRRTGRELPPDVTLGALEGRIGATEGSRGYLRALSDLRYGLGGSPPSGRQRAALRHELAAGLGRLGRLRAWWALPPRLGG